MAIDVHAHYIPQSLIVIARERDAKMGVHVVDRAATTPALEFSYGFKVRPFFPKLTETTPERIAWLDSEVWNGNSLRPGPIFTATTRAMRRPNGGIIATIYDEDGLRLAAMPPLPTPRTSFCGWTRSPAP
jgi:hypothetical protein